MWSALMGLAMFAGVPSTVYAQPSQYAFAGTDLANTPNAGISAMLLVNKLKDIHASNRGWYSNDGANNGGSAVNSFFVGVCGQSDCLDDVLVMNNWFLFDLSEFSTVTSAILRLRAPINGYRNDAGTSSLDYLLHQISGNYGALGLGPSTAMFRDLGDGTFFGSTTIVKMDYEHLFEIELNAAGLAALNNERQNNFWAVGGSIRYDMQVVPEPSTYALLCAGLAGIAFAHRKRKKAA